MKVLVAEDDQDIQVILRMVLTRLGKCDVVMTSQGDEVLGLAKEHLPQLILLDLMLPELSGFEICKLLKADDHVKHVPVIFLTARAMTTELNTAISLGASGYLAKPFDPMLLIGQINAITTPLGVTLGA